MTSTIEKFDEKKRRNLKISETPNFGKEDYSSLPNWEYYRQPPPLMLEDQSSLDLGVIFKSFWYYRGMFATIALILATILVLGNQFIFPNKYEATARVRVKMTSFADSGRTAQNFSIIPSEVLSDKVLTKVINDLELTKHKTDPVIVKILSAIGITPKETIEDGSGIMRWLRKDVVITQERQGAATAIFSVSLTDKDPDAASDIVNSIVNSYINLHHTFETSDASEAVAFLQPKVDAAQKNVDDAHKQLTKFQMENTAYLVPAETIENNISRLQNEFTTSLNRIEELKELNSGLKKLLNGEPRYVSASSVQNGGVSVVDSELEVLNQKYTLAQTRYKKGHPYLNQLKNDIDALKKASKNQPVRSIITSGQVSNPEWLRISQEITANNAEYTVLENRIPSIKENIVKLTKHLSRAQSAQAALLTHQSMWDQAYNRLRLLSEQLLDVKMKADAQDNAVGKDLSVLDKATIPTLPVSASRIKLQLMGLFGGIFVAFVIVLIYARFKNFEIPETTGQSVSVIKSFALNALSISWIMMLFVYIIINPYI